MTYTARLCRLPNPSKAMHSLAIPFSGQSRIPPVTPVLREPAVPVAATTLQADAGARRVQPGSSRASAGGTSSTCADSIAGASRHGRDRVCDRRPDADYWVGRFFDGVGAAQGAGEDQAASMFPVPTGVRVWLATGHTDMRAFRACRSRCRRFCAVTRCADIFFASGDAAATC